MISFQIDRVLAVETDDEDDKDEAEADAPPSAAAAADDDDDEEEGVEPAWEAVEEEGEGDGKGKGKGGGDRKAEGGASHEEETGTTRRRCKYLVKWCGLPSSEATWEKWRDLRGKGLEAHVAAYRRRQVGGWVGGMDVVGCCVCFFDFIYT